MFRNKFILFFLASIFLLSLAVIIERKEIKYGHTSLKKVSLAEGSYAAIFNDATPRRVVFFLPHQDDDMFMGGAIVAALEAQKQVYVVMVTDGGASKVRDVLNGVDIQGKLIYSVLDKMYHHPNREGYHFLSRRLFSVARNQEFFAAIINLGVPKDNIYFANPGGIFGSEYPVYQDGQLTKELATKVVSYYFNFLGAGTYITVGAQLGIINDLHGDHLALRDGLADFSGVTEKYFFSEKSRRGNRIFLTDEQRFKKFNALGDYYTWNPQRGRFAVAKHSVGVLLDGWRTSTAEYVLALSDIMTSTSK